MAKLTPAKIKWIIRQKERGELTTEQIARIQRITPRRVNQLWQAYRNTGEIPELKDPGRPRKPITVDQIKAVLEAHNKYRLGACMLEPILEVEFGVKMSHNKIHVILREHGLARREPKKAKRRKWVRYERKHSMSLWHTDWKYLKQLKKWMIAYLDDSSRLVVSYGLFDNATTENAIAVLEEGIKRYGLPDAVLTDRGSQFYANAGEKKAKGECEFERYLRVNGIRHIVGRVNHPQTNGKVERFYGTVEQKLKFFESVDELVKWYNEIKPHMSLNLEELETPAQAFYRKLPPERIMGYVSGWMFAEVKA
jgi:putative transposase